MALAAVLNPGKHASEIWQLRCVQSLSSALRALANVPTLLWSVLRPSPVANEGRPLSGWLRFFFLASLYALMVLRWGYEYGRNDQMQTLAYAQMLADPSLYPVDFYLRGVHEHVPNERFVFSRLLALGAANLPLVSLVGHVFFSLLLLHYMDRIAGLFVRNDALRWGLLLALFVPLYGVNLGGNELWYNSFFVSNVVKTLGMAGIWWLLQGRVWPVFAAFAAVALMQPVVGIQLFGLASGALFLTLVGQRKSAPLAAATSWAAWFGSNALWLLTAGVWIIFLRIHFEEESPPNPDRFFDILFVFRAPHHYWPPSWSLKSWVVEGTLAVAAWVFFRRRAPILGQWIALSFLACGLYLLGTVGLRFTEAGALQGFKVTIWLEFFGLVALAAWLEPFADWAINPRWQQRFRRSLSLLTLFALVLAFGFGGRIPLDVPRDTRALAERGSAVDICIQASTLTPVNACFAHPIGFTELKVYGKRSSYVDYKVLVHTRAAMHRWYARIQLLYGLSLEQDLPASQRYHWANNYFRNLSPVACQDLAAAGITHLLTFGNVQLPFPVVCRNSHWVIYLLQPQKTIIIPGQDDQEAP